jgi:prolipoprotein diacylglyceryl transferase
VLTSIPSPSQGVWHLGPFPIRAYALCIIVGIIVAINLGERRWQARGGAAGTVGDVAIWAVPFGIIGGRLYHLATTPQPYFGKGGHPADAIKIWNGGLGIWGAVLLGGVGAWIACHRKGIPLPPMADALAPGIVIAQAIGRWGNYFNQELFGRPTTLPWGLRIDPAHRPANYPNATTFHPTFLYESIWCLLVAALCLWADRRWRLGHGRVFALYVASYVVGRAAWESLRADPANDVFGLRINIWVCLIVFIGSVTYLVVSSRRHPGRESVEEISAADPPRNQPPADPDHDPDHEPDPPVEVPAEA